jgi:hypothetical protein
MMNPTYHFAGMRELLDEYEPGRERSLAATKLDECELWLTRCTPTREAVERDQAAFTPVGYQGAAAHTFTTGCDGFHPVGEQCNLSNVPDRGASENAL